MIEKLCEDEVQVKKKLWQSFPASHIKSRKEARKPDY